MKNNCTCLSLLLLGSVAARAQNTFPSTGAAGIGTTTPAASSVLEVKSTTKGALLPRMTMAQRNAIASPAQGLILFQTDGTKGFYYYDGGWKQVTPSGANTALSNLAATTAVNVHLLPNTTNLRNIGSASKAWKDLYLRGDVYLDGYRFLTSKNTSSSVYLGTSAGNATTTGSSNVAIGTEVLSNNTTGSQNTAVGYQALQYNNYNTFDEEGIVTGGGTGNTAVGYQASFRGGIFNTAVGYQALYNSEAGQNTAIGAEALFSNTEGYGNTAGGRAALLRNINGTFNSAFGDGALAQNQYGALNTAIGMNAMGFSSDGYENTAVGSNAAIFVSNPEGVTFLGALTSAADDLSNMTAVGYGAHVGGSNQVRIGNTAVTSIGGNVGWTNFSDGRYKKNIKTDVPGLEFINKLRPATYNLDVAGIDNAINSGRPARAGNINAISTAPQKKEPSAAMIKARQERAKIVYTGFVAQEVEEAAKSLNYDFSGVDKPKNEKDFYGLRYAEFVVPLVKAVQEINEKLEVENNQLKQQVNELNERLTKLEVRLGTSGNSSLSFSTGTYLEQNIPNPSARTTTIRYYVPENSGTAQLILTNMKGQQVKQVNLNSKGAGQVTINTGALAAGAYTYTLLVGGKQVASRQLVIAR